MYKRFGSYLNHHQCESDIFQNEITYIKQLLTANGFPYHIINKLLKRFLKSKSTNSISLPKFGPERKPVFLFLPFWGNNSLKLKRQLEHLMNNIAPWTKLYAIFKPSNKFQKPSKLKETVPILNRSNVIYKINCSSCNDFYVGLTTDYTNVLMNTKNVNFAQCISTILRKTI